MTDRNKSIIYWKWEDSTLDSDLIAKIDDLCNRTEMSTVCIGLHWLKRRYHDQKVFDALSRCSEELHKRGRSVVVEACPRNEGAAFFEKFPKDIGYVTTATEISLDSQGKGETVIDTTGIPHYWRMIEYEKPILLSAYTISKCGEYLFGQDSWQHAEKVVTLLPKDDNSTIVSVQAGQSSAGKSVVAFVGIPQPIPDLASERLPELYEEMLNHLKNANIDGVMSDEWGYDVIIRMEEQDNIDKKKPEIYFEHVTYSKDFAKRYEDICDGKLLEDLLYFYYQEEGCREKSIQKVNAYHKTFRTIMSKNDEDMYALAKQKLGADAFYGVHPTWWGNNYLQNFEGFKNGLYWWEAKRDIAQTDEIVIMPIRTALTHKWGCDYWYNMWYSMGTRDINTYYRETWNNVRFGGRTHYLAYECPNEAVVLELKPEGLLESIEEMDAVVRTLDPYQKASPDCRVLVLFGMENSLNWFYNDQAAPPWYPRHKILSTVLECADRIFDQYLCDLVPTSEIVNGSLSVKDGRVSYGTQVYDTVVLLAPDSLNKTCFLFLSQIDKSRFIVAGEAQEYDDGRRLTAEDCAILDSGKRIMDLFSPDEIISLLQQWNISTNRFTNGCVLQDGSLIFTAEGKYPVHNPLTVQETYQDLCVDFEGEDLLYLHQQEGKYTPIYQKGTCTLKMTDQV